MTKNVILLAGLPGCGKTTYLCRMCGDGWLIFDDFKANAYENSSAFRKSRKFPALIVALRHGLKCVVADIDFCKAASREEADKAIRYEMGDVALAWRLRGASSLTTHPPANGTSRGGIAPRFRLI